MFATTQAGRALKAAPEFDEARALRDSLKAASAVNRGGRVFLGTVLLVSAVGLWAVPVDAGDAAMRMIKLLFSACMLGLGAMFILSASDRGRRPEIRLDTQARVLHVMEPSGRFTLDFDELVDVVIGKRVMTARSADGRVRLNLPIGDARTGDMLRAAFPGAS